MLHASGPEGGIIHMVTVITVNVLCGHLNGSMLHLKWPFKFELSFF